MPQAQFKNFASSVIADVGGISAVATVVNLLTGDGAKFPALSGGDWFYAILFQKSGSAEINHEVVKVTGRAADALTIVRAQDGTTARAFNQSDYIELRVVSANFADERTLNDTKDAAVSASLVGRHQRFTASGTWVCPAGITSIMADGCGGGGDGGNGGAAAASSGADVGGGGGGGGGDGSRSTKVITVVPLTEYAITIGAGGAATSFGVLGTWAAGNNGGAGGNASYGTPGVAGRGGLPGAGEGAAGGDGTGGDFSKGGTGGNSGARGGTSASNGGNAGNNSGKGGGGGGGQPTTGGTAGTGGAGGSGFLNIWW